MATKKEQNNGGMVGIKYEDRWQKIVKYHHGVEDFIHGNDGPWPQPAPDNPVGQMAEVVHLSEQEKIDWKKKVGNMYTRRVLTCWPFGLWYALTHKEYKYFDDAAFNEEISEGLYSKFLTKLDTGDLKYFKDERLKLETPSHYYKADFSCMEPIAPHCYQGMYAAPTITLLKKDQSDVYGLRHQVVAIYIYEVKYNKGEDEPEIISQKVLLPEDGDAWHLAKYYVLQGAVHRVNLTEHALLHFPYDSINAISKTILPTSHLLFQLLIPHLELSLGVNKAVLENPGSLINRKKHKFYSPFCAEGIYIRKLLPDGYIGRGPKKKNAYPKYEFPYEKPRFVDSDYGRFLKAYYDVFAEFVPRVLEQIEDDDEESWQYIALWLACIEEWMPGFPIAEEIVLDGKPVDRDKLNKIVTLVMWDLSLAHANDHIAIHNKRPHGNPFRLRVPPPTQGEVPPDWHANLVTRLDLLTFWFTDLLFYKPNNVTLLQEVKYPFKLSGEGAEKKEQYLKNENKKFVAALHECEKQLQEGDIHLSSRLNQISTSLQY